MNKELFNAQEIEEQFQKYLSEYIPDSILHKINNKRKFLNPFKWFNHLGVLISMENMKMLELTKAFELCTSRYTIAERNEDYRKKYAALIKMIELKTIFNEKYQEDIYEVIKSTKNAKVETTTRPLEISN